MQTARRNNNGNLIQPTRQDVINWVSRAWREISEETIVKSFLRCGISNSLDGSQDDEVSDDIPSADEDLAALREEAVALLFDYEGEDSDIEFAGF